MKIELSGGFLGVLFLIFLVLKLCNVINWSWWWIFAPLYPAAVLILFIVVLGIFTLLIARK